MKIESKPEQDHIDVFYFAEHFVCWARHLLLLPRHNSSGRARLQFFRNSEEDKAERTRRNMWKRPSQRTKFKYPPG